MTESAFELRPFLFSYVLPVVKLNGLRRREWFRSSAQENYSDDGHSDNRDCREEDCSFHRVLKSMLLRLDVVRADDSQESVIIQIFDELKNARANRQTANAETKVLLRCGKRLSEAAAPRAAESKTGMLITKTIVSTSLVP